MAFYGGRRAYRLCSSGLIKAGGCALAAIVVASACSDGGDDLVDGSGVTSTTEPTTIQAAPLPDATGESDGSDEAETTTSVAEAEAPGDEVRVEDPTVCGTSRVNSQPFYAVANIEENDPDGGLNLRSDFERGVRLATLPEGTVVLAEDCVISSDGGTWYAVQTTDGQFGWVNAAFLSTEISPLVPTSGGQETEDKVTAVLDALAARKWEEAAAELSAGGDGVRRLNRLLERSAGSVGDLPDLLESYCQVRLCDAPYTVVETRGSYLPTVVPPEVDVRFDYPGGSTVETFARIETEEGQSLDTLPGQSNLAWTVSRPTVAALWATSTDTAPDGLLDSAEAVRLALLSENGPELLAPFVPDEGTAFSANGYVDPVPAARVRVRRAELLNSADQLRIWGYQDGIGTAIVDSIEGWVGHYRRSIALLEPDVVAAGERIGFSNTIANLPDLFPSAHIVEFHRRGRGELADFNWSSVRIALEQRPEGWMVVAITSDSWTI